MLIAAPPLTKNREGMCGPEMHKAIERQPLALRHEGQHRRDTATGLLRRLIGTVANVADVTQVDKQLHEQESHVSAIPATPMPQSALSMSALIEIRCQRSGIGFSGKPWLDSNA